MLFRTLRAFVLIMAALATGACGEALVLGRVVPGRVVTVWVTGAELRSYPVQVTAVYIALER